MNCQCATKAATATILIAVLAVSLSVGAIALLSPLNEQARPTWHPLVPLTLIPDDNVPYRFPIYVASSDAWMRLPDRLTGHVYVRRLPETDTLTTLAATHHSELKIPVDFNANTGVFESVCWNATFDLSGQYLDDYGLEDIQSLESRVVDGMVYIATQH